MRPPSVWTVHNRPRITVLVLKCPASGFEAGHSLSRGDESRLTGADQGAAHSAGLRSFKSNESRTLPDRFGIYSDAKSLKAGHFFFLERGRKS
jgi:hypothetical protein